ncbi:DUF2975 domain-containing protein [Actinopolymorpha pittospori]|uniref:DUF2975 domain-containing protein n=1 Tax=Actinopolymorpha pittospori TaxID=648752 RepID=A0A927N562_9ACTN|nr:DUF2975 domain-containing protein [Actinopolymorpha pittospori]MBE1611183.1 hypothetical protein [Actinopolymorpha pittospori]
MGETSRSNQSATTDRGAKEANRPPMSRSVRLSTHLVARAALLTAVGAILSALWFPIYQLTQSGGSVWVWTDAPDPRVSVPTGTSLEFLQPAHSVQYIVDALPWWLRLLTTMPSALAYLSVGIGAVMLRRLVLTIREGRPFDRRNPRRIGVIAIMVAVGTSVTALVEGFAGRAVVHHVADVTDTPSLVDTIWSYFPRYEFEPLVVAAAIAVVAIAFRRGQQLTKDVEGLV